MPMADLKRTPKKQKDLEAKFKEGPREDFFPLSLHVSSEEIAKLGLSGAEVGDERMLAAKVKVTSASVNQREGSTKNESMTLTLIKGEVSDIKPVKSQAERLFSEGS